MPVSLATADTSTEMAMGSAVNGEPGKSWWSRLRHEWTKNDGKPWEEWEPGPDLKDRVLVSMAVAAHLLFIGAMIWMLIKT